MFDTDKIIAWLQSYFVPLVSVLAFFACIALGVLVFDNWTKNQEVKVKNQLGDFQKSLQDTIAQSEKIDSTDTENPLLDSKEKELVLTDEMRAKASAYKNAIEENKKYKITSYFAIDLAEFYHSYNEGEKAIELLTAFAKPTNKKTLYQLASFQLANYFMEDKKCEQALILLEQLLANASAKGLSLEASLQKGICLEHLGRYQEALKEYDKLAIENPDTYLARQAKDYKHLLVLKQKLNKKTSP